MKVSVGATYEANVTVGRHLFLVDEPVKAGGNDAGPNPESLLLSALGCCMAITLRMYANRKGWPLEEVEIQLSLERSKEMKATAKAEVNLIGNLTEEMHSRLLDIARKCPMHKTLTQGVAITVSGL